MVRPTAFKILTHYYIEHITPIEANIMRRFCALRSFAWLTWVFKSASRLGDGPLWVASGVGLLALSDPYINTIFFAAISAVGLSVVLFMAMKNLVGRPRPFEAWQGLSCLAAPPDKFSFPSGHTMTAFSVWGVMAVGLPILSPFYLAMAILIGLSRVFLGLHYPTDVLVGALLGGTIGLAIATLVIS
ncbi:MAG: phosphatase PAP2 family protein [Deltaproteobacteria bacterium]|jgi:undecaprenyl-diphosphatase|nr:phosphatase PAP2 family protein [Deltaproteobacteria bacterium]